MTWIPTLFLLVATAGVRSEWDIAVVSYGSVELLTDEGNSVGTAAHSLRGLGALSYDLIYGNLYLADDQHQNATIFRFQVSPQGDTSHLEPVVARIHTSVNDLAFDVMENKLYWTTESRHIMAADLDTSAGDLVQSISLFNFTNEMPEGIAIDPCRRYLYWTNANYPSASIERSRLDGSGHEVLVRDTAERPLGIPKSVSLLLSEGLMYWVSKHLGSRYVIERSRLDGTGRETVFRGNDYTPFHLAALPDTLYWTDSSSSGSVWKLTLDPNRTSNSDDAVATRVRHFDGRVKGIVARNRDLHLHREDCKDLIAFRDKAPKTWMKDKACLNGGRRLPSGECFCDRGYTGEVCEVSVCQNFCLNGGKCETGPSGSPVCSCPAGSEGQRCELTPCALPQGYCLNGATCIHPPGPDQPAPPRCLCTPHFAGNRCQFDIGLCHLLCSFDLHKYTNICGCDRLMNETGGVPRYEIIESSENRPVLGAAAAAATVEGSAPQTEWRLAALTLTCAASLLVGCVLVLAYKVWSMRKRPRLRKRYKPSAQQQQQQQEQRRGELPEHCEIAIENCCNMNICETPCCEPEFRTINGSSNKKSLKEEKKGLLDNMETIPPSSCSSNMY